MRETKKTTRSQWLVNAAMIAALYVVLTFAQNTLLPGTASMPVQFRVAEVVTIFALYTSAAIPGLTVGCIIANLSSIAALGAYKNIRDYVVFTNKRAIAVNVQGMTGKKRDYTSLPYAKISAYSVETSGVGDIDSELELWYSGLGRVRFEFSGSSDIRQIGRLIATYTL